MRRDELRLPPPPSNDRPSDHWVCGRTSDHPPCSRGPTANGLCPLADVCQPRRTWQGRRKQIVLAGLLCLIVGTILITSSQSTATIFKPGELSSPHAQILAGTLTSQRCASCHPQAATSPRSWFQAGWKDHAGVSQTDRCMDCHHTTIPRSTAKFAHNLPPTVRDQLRLTSLNSVERSWHDALPGPAVNQEDLQCSACHKEHHGAIGDLLAVSDSQCQSCHSDRFGSFANSHPEWGQWPYGRGRQLSFNHATHANKHFPATMLGDGVAQFQCDDCHTRTADNELTRSTSYTRACQPCHDESLRIEAANGVDLLALPTLPPESAGRIQPWPELATGFYDGKVSPIAAMLLRADPQAAAALRTLPDGDFSRIDGREQNNVVAAEVIARAHRQLLNEISESGQRVIIDRARSMGVATSTLQSLVQSLSPQFVMDANRRWFALGPATTVPEVRQTEYRAFPKPRGSILFAAHANDGGRNSAGADDLLQGTVVDDGLTSDDTSMQGGDLLTGSDESLIGDDPLTEDPLLLVDPSKDDTAASGSRFDADQMMPAGGWYREDLQMAIRYRGSGHEDRVLKATVEMISQLPNGDPVREQLLGTRAIAACVACHPGIMTSQRGWRSEPLIGRRNEFTKFSHSPHLNVAKLADCSHCHSLESGSEDDLRLASGASQIHEFAPMRREACADCHTPHAAGEACVKCHRYHIDLR